MSNGPFGLGLGMKLQDLNFELEEVANFKYRTTSVPKPHSAFESYILFITPINGLSWIKGIGKDIQTNAYGVELRLAFSSFKGRLENVYGNSDETDFIMEDSIWCEPKDWLRAIQLKERFLCATWKADYGSKMKESLVSVSLIASAIDDSTGFLSIEYEFSNNYLAERELILFEDECL